MKSSSKGLFNDSQKKTVLKAAYRILSDENIIVELYEGQLTKSNILTYKTKLLSDSLFKSEYTIFGDMRNCEIDALVTDIDEYLEHIKQNEQYIMDKGKHVGIVSSANHYFFIQLFKENFDDEIQNQGMFISVEDGLEFIEKAYLRNEINKIFEELKLELKEYS